MQCHFLGPIPVKEFFRKFLPAQKLSEEDRAALPGFEFEAMADAKEHSMYEGLVRHFPHPVYFSFPIVVVPLGQHCEFILFQHQSIQLSKGFGY